MAENKIYYSVKPRGTILIWLYSRDWNNFVHNDTGKIYRNQYGTEVIIRDKGHHPLPEGFFGDRFLFMNHLQDSFEKYGKLHRITLGVKLEKLENRK
jgi:hypothetical protein